MRVGFFSPLPPAATGVADYSAVLLKALQKHGDVLVDDQRADVALYHIGNNHLHRDIYRAAIARPGVAVIHDAVLQHFFLGTLSAEQYIDEFIYNYGEWTRGLAEDLWNSRARSAADPRYFAYPMLKRIAKASRSVIVHNPAAAAVVRRHNPEARVIEIPHLFAPPPAPDAVETLRFRARLGISSRTLLAGVFGHLRESKRIGVILRAADLAWAEGVDLKLLVQGEFASSDLHRAVGTRLEQDPRILRVGFLVEREFWKWAAAADVCLNLRFPSAAETSGIAVAMMGIGKAVVFTAGDEVVRIPEDACLRVEAGAAEEQELADYLVWLAAEKSACDQIGKRAAEYVRTAHAVDRVAREYWEVLRLATNAERTSREHE